MGEQDAKDHEHNLKNHKHELEAESRANHKELQAVVRMSRATLSHGHVLQSSVEDVQIDNVRDLLKVEKGGLGTNRSEFFQKLQPEQKGRGTPRES